MGLGTKTVSHSSRRIFDWERCRLNRSFNSASDREAEEHPPNDIASFRIVTVQPRHKYDFNNNTQRPQTAEKYYNKSTPVALRLEGQDINIRIFENESPLFNIVYPQGLKSRTLTHARDYALMARMGVAIMPVELPDPEKGIGFLPFYEEILKEVLLGNNSQINDFINSRPTILATHSTSGLLLTKLLHNPATAIPITEKFQAGFMNSPFYTASFRRKSWLVPIYNWHASKYWDNHLGNTSLERLHSFYNKYIAGEPQTPASIKLTHQQIAYMCANGEKFMEEAGNRDFPGTVKEWPLFMYYGSKDYIACPVAGTEMGRRMNAQVYILPNMWHNLLVEGRDIKRMMLEDAGRVMGHPKLGKPFAFRYYNAGQQPQETMPVPDNKEACVN